MISAADIERAKIEVRYSLGEGGHHEHDDCIRIAYEWLDAQKKIQGKVNKAFALKHLIEKWGGRYVSTTDVDVAAHLHPDINGTYPYFNISSRLTLPSDERLKGIGEAFSQGYRDRLDQSAYKIFE